MYEGGLKVPTCISWPGKIKPESVSENYWMTMDIYPTLLEIAGTKPSDAIEGRSFYNELLGLDQVIDADRSFYFVRREGNMRYGGQPIYALRKGDWKLLQNSPYEKYELYNLSDDPREQKNLIDQEPEKYKELNAILMEHIQMGGRTPWQRGK